MRLKKYYFDCYIKESDEIIIGYSAKLERGMMSVPYSCIMYKKKDGELYQKQYFTEGKVLSGGDLEDNGSNVMLWNCSYPKIEGKWEGGEDTGVQTLFSSEGGNINWHCTNNGADVKIKWNENEYSGKGYAEYVEVTLPLWKLPFTDLKWGRWVSENGNEGITWISWEDKTGSGNKLSRIWDSEVTEGEVFYTGSDILIGNRKIEIMEKKEIRKEIVSRSILGNRSILSLILPKKLKNIDERKYYSRGLFEGKEGNVIFEEVFWK